MKKNVFIGMVVWMFIVTSISFAQVSGMSTPYICADCASSFTTEALLGDHKLDHHNIDLQIQKELLVFQEDLIPAICEKKYTPVKYYLCPETEQGFFSEVQLCMHLNTL